MRAGCNGMQWHRHERKSIMQETGGIVSLVRRRIIQRIVHCNRVRTVIFAMLALALNGVPAMAQTSYSQPKLQAAVRVLSADPTGTLRDP